ncbi:serine hydrolase [Dyella mobilis]|uniref:Serine hydrolase n=1 Tax=Dyella mobilis TaxID=1849582 RepID=A0ABS2KEK3_9GAMM|nr:serine hydrolase [Dyella mobilis]MBM7129601.1 serine hydrolase [Dyella mobilis]GLQ98135.1 penicillin-binding protein [Dyella mobilis]
MLAANAVAADSLIPARVEQAIRDRVAAGENPTVVVAVVDGSQSAIYEFGKLDSGAAPTPSTVYEIGSVTKTFTATLLANFVVKGQLRLDQPLSTLLPGFTIPSKDGKAITLANIAEQNSGLPRLPSNMKPADPTDPYADYDAAKLKQFLAAYTLPRDPGARYEYSNLAVGLLGYALGQHAGTGYPALLKSTIFDPLKMKDSSVGVSNPDPTGMAGGHDAMGKPVPGWHLDALAGAGAIRSTGADMLRYLQANMGLLPSPLLPAMQLAQTARTSAGSSTVQIGLIWMTQHDGRQPEIVWHNGMTGGYASFIGFTSDRKHGVVILTNAQVDVDDLGFASLRPDWQLEPSRKSVAMSPDQLKVYEGAYQLSPKMVLRLSLAGDQLMAQAAGQQGIPIYPSSRDEFFARIGGISMSFKRNADGSINRLVLHQHGDHPAPKITEAAAASIEGVKETTLDPAVLQQYVGRYNLVPDGTFVITVDQGQLMAKLASQPTFPIYASAKDHFFYRVVDAQIDFERDASGKVTALVLHQNGKTMRAPRAGG